MNDNKQIAVHRHNFIAIIMEDIYEICKCEGCASP
jgi:hypothetical protein